MPELLPAPEDCQDPRTRDSRDRSGRRRERDQTPIPSVDEIQRMLLKLNSAVAIGAISNATGSLIHRNLCAVLKVQMAREGRGGGGSDQQALAEACRRDPRVLNALEPFLTDEMLDSLMDEVGGTHDGPV